MISRKQGSTVKVAQTPALGALKKIILDQFLLGKHILNPSFNGISASLVPVLVLRCPREQEGWKQTDWSSTQRGVQLPQCPQSCSHLLAAQGPKGKQTPSGSRRRTAHTFVQGGLSLPSNALKKTLGVTGRETSKRSKPGSNIS